MILKEILAQFDSIDKKDFNELNVSIALREITPENGDSQDSEVLSEVMAFGFAEAYHNKTHGWGTYFGPMWVQSNSETTIEFPSITMITPEVVNYWEKRAKESQNPILTSRYSGLVYDFQSKITGTHTSYEIRHLYVKALIEIANGDYNKYPANTYLKLRRAIEVAISLNDSPLIEEGKNSVINYENRHSQDTKPGLWGGSFDMLIDNNKIKLTKAEEDSIIKELENKLIRLVRPDANGQKIDPWAAEAAAERLAGYYRKNKRLDDVRRVITEIGKAYEKIIGDASAMQASGWLDHLHRIYKKYNLNDEADKILLKLREYGPKTDAELKSVPFSYDFDKKEFDNYINTMTSGSIEEVLMRFTTEYIPCKEEVKKELLNLSKEAPLTYIMSHSLQDEKGRKIVTIGPLQNDLEGHIIRHISQKLSISSVFIREILKETESKFGLFKSDIMKLILKTPIIQKERYEIIERGLDAYFSNDHIIVAHLLIPQIEEAVRNLLEMSGGNVLKPSQAGGYHLRIFDDILRDAIVKKILGEDLPDYFKVLFTDQRGWNLRNRVSHGMISPKMFSFQTSDRLIHALLCLSLIRSSQS